MKNLLVLFISFLLVIGSGNLALAAERDNDRDAKKDNCNLISSNDAINQANAQTGGKVVSVKLSRNGAKSVYKVRVLVDEKRIKNITIKACR
jgi:uncharacterized membrane protein YkoI